MNTIVTTLNAQHATECYNIFCLNKSQFFYPAFLGQLEIQFCSICLDLYATRKCCYFCAQVYHENQNNFLDGKNWIMCDTCNKWMHLECEQQSGIEDILILIKDDQYQYVCPYCRVNSKKQYKKRKISMKHHNIINKQVDSDSYQRPNRKRMDHPLIDFVLRPSHFDVLLTKYGGYNQSVQMEDIVKDLDLIQAAIDR